MTVHDLPAPPVPALPPVGRTTPRELRAAAEHAIAEADNPFKLVARYRKARKVADALLRLGATEASIPELEGEQGALYRALAAQVADVNAPSEVTWALVLELLRESG